MAILVPPGSFYDVNRDMYFDTRASQAQYEKEMFLRRQEEKYRRMKNAWSEAPQHQEKLVNTAPKPDLNDPLSFLSKADNKLLLTGEAS